MVDFWEVLGRATTDDAFRNEMFDSFANSFPPVPDQTNKYACRFDDRDYDAARKTVVAKMGPVSLMALGEWFVVCKLHPDSRPVLDKAAQIAQGILNGYRSPNPVFYQALGAALLDSNFRAAFNGGHERDYGFNLSAPDRAALAQIIGNNGFQGHSGSFHNLSWSSGGCKDMVIQWAAHPYAHALETPFIRPRARRPAEP